MEINLTDVGTTVTAGAGGALGLALVLQKVLSTFSRERAGRAASDTTAVVSEGHLAEITRLADLVASLSRTLDNATLTITTANATIEVVRIHIENLLEGDPEIRELLRPIVAALDRYDKRLNDYRTETSDAQKSAEAFLRQHYGDKK